jgi:L-asparaginase II
MASPLSVVVERGGVVEATHRVHAVAVRDGRVVEAAGDAELVTHMRSVAKPFLSLPLSRDYDDVTDAELAIASGSHDALPDQLDVVQELLGRSGSTEAELECGVERGSKLAHPCSGKHAGMLLRAKRQGWPLPGYRLPDHPMQREAAACVAEAAGVATSELREGVDGCGVVSFAMSLRAHAHAFARLARRELEGSERVVAAMLARPELVGGPDASDTALMRAHPGALAKRGREGLLCIALADGTGVAVKVADGSDRAAAPAAARFLGLLELAAFQLFNSRGDVVGHISAAR